ncbi:MAG TPA: redoxin domain-containing protein [Terracidiphilus sp.]|nr:redoxin domain-containing protein [Terracidiphilus sp.]
MSSRHLKISFIAFVFVCAALYATLRFTARAQVDEARVGAQAPAFTATDSRGQTVSLNEFRGKFVVLEWHNQGCPYTRKHYVSGNMQALQKEWTAKGVEWFTVISSAPGEQGYVTDSEENAYLAKMHADPTAALLDPDGKVGRLYGAKTTPEMYVIDPEGRLIYEGAIDNRPTPDVEDIKGADNYVSDALSEAMAGKAVATAYTRPYGCSVKYRD